MRFKTVYLSSVLFAFAACLSNLAQSDNFDSGVLDPAWKRSQFSPALVNLSFPDGPTGKALRIQANPVPNQAPAAGMLYRDELYTNFYMAVDVVDWPGTDKNQAIVLLARAHITANPLETTGIIMNYDASQYGENPTDRRQGQLQINMVTNNPPFGTKTLTVAEVTLQPGRPYRFVFEGVGPNYTGRIYDLHDLTRPLVTIEANDEVQGSLSGGGSVFFEPGTGFKSGVSGILSFSRQGNTGTTDVTIDNYFVAAADPNPGAKPGLAHPVAGTPVVSSRIPANRFENFHPRANGLSFTVITHTTNLVNAAATKLRLNGTDLSSQLVVPENGNTISVHLPGSALTGNTVYSAQIEVEDVSGTKKSTNTFWFDTFSDAYLTNAAVKIIEAEEYNYDGGSFQPDPIPVSGLATNGVAVNGGGVGYWELAGIPEIDYRDARTSPEGTWAAEFRSADFVGLSAGMFPEFSSLADPAPEPVRYSDNVRAKYASSNLLEYVVHRTEPGEWLNYTRTFGGGPYLPYLRVASFGATDVELYRVTSDPKAPDQTTNKLGTFRIPNLFTRYNYRYIPLVNDAGAPATITGSGTNTLRLQMAGTPGQDARKIAMNYLLLVPQPVVAFIEVESSATVNGPYTLDTTVTSATGPDGFSIPLPSGNRFYRLRANAGNPRISSFRVVGGALLLNWTNAN
jgi:hypothetical protein